MISRLENTRKIAKQVLKRYKYVSLAHLQKTNTHAFEIKQFNGDFNSYT